MKKLCVIGSINMDLVTTVEDFPKPGETISGKDFKTFPGGKGANQAVALGKLGADVLMIGKVGEDVYGKTYMEVFEKSSVKNEGVHIENGISTGVAIIEVNKKGENHIVVVAGANGKVDSDYIESRWNSIKEADIFLFQLEISIDIVIQTMKRLKEQGKIVILDPAPAIELPSEIYKYLDYITPNETEIQRITGQSINNEEELKDAAEVMLKRGVNTVIVKMGKQGAYIFNKDGFTHVPGFKVNAIDTTAAGDSFNAGFAFALAQNKEILDSVKFANAVGAISTTALGAQEAMPSFDKVKEFLKENTK